jgi:hypothetical protein
MAMMYIRVDERFCAEECELGEDADHYVRNHSKALLHLAQREVVRSGDGPAVIRFWQVYLPEFWNGGHFKYTIAAHQLLASVYTPTIFSAFQSVPSNTADIVVVTDLYGCLPSFDPTESATDLNAVDEEELLKFLSGCLETDFVPDYDEDQETGRDDDHVARLREQLDNEREKSLNNSRIYWMNP